MSSDRSSEEGTSEFMGKSPDEQEGSDDSGEHSSEELGEQMPSHRKKLSTLQAKKAKKMLAKAYVLNTRTGRQN